MITNCKWFQSEITSPFLIGGFFYLNNPFLGPVVSVFLFFLFVKIPVWLHERPEHSLLRGRNRPNKNFCRVQKTKQRRDGSFLWILVCRQSRDRHKAALILCCLFLCGHFRLPEYFWDRCVPCDPSGVTLLSMKSSCGRSLKKDLLCCL